MRTACFIPIKANSERIQGKNLRILNGKPLYRYLCEHVREAEVFDDVYIDTNSAEISEYARTMGFEVIERLPELAQNTANGNDLLVHHFELHPDYDYYFQLFVTAPYMKPETICACWEKLTCSAVYDSCFYGNRKSQLLLAGRKSDELSSGNPSAQSGYGPGD